MRLQYKNGVAILHGLVFAGSLLSPDIGIGTTSSFFQGSGKLFEEKELLIRLVVMGAITGELQNFGINFVTTGSFVCW